MPDYRGMDLVLPSSDTEYRPYFEAAADGRLTLQRCARCHRLRYPPGPACPWCSAQEFDWETVTGSGVIYSYEVVTQAIQPGFTDAAPYVIVLVELDEQKGRPTPEEAVRILANLVRPDFRPEAEENVAIGARVDVVFEPLGDGLALPQCRLSGDQSSDRLWRMAE